MNERISAGRSERTSSGSRKVKPQLKVIRVAAGSFFIGEIHLDEQNRVRRRADTVPSDIVLKVLIQVTRQGETCGKLAGRKDSREFYWHVVGTPLPDLTDVCTDENLELADVCGEAA